MSRRAISLNVFADMGQALRNETEVFSEYIEYIEYILEAYGFILAYIYSEIH